MAAPIGHLYLALKILSGPLRHIDEKKFIVGSLFPDIRYPAQLTRETTHKHGITWLEIIQEKNSFKKGMLFHAFVDEKREKYIRNTGIHHLLPQFPHVQPCFKVTEDLFLLKKLSNKQSIHYFNTIFDEEKLFVQDEKIIQDWHIALQNYIFYGPTPQTIRPLLRNSIPELGALKAIIEVGASYGFKFETNLLALDNNLMEQIMKFYNQFEQLFIKNIATLDSQDH